MRPVCENLNVPVLKLKAELRVPEGSPGVNCDKLLMELVSAVKGDFPRIISVRTDVPLRDEGAILMNFGVSLAAEVKHE